MWKSLSSSKGYLRMLGDDQLSLLTENRYNEGSSRAGDIRVENEEGSIVLAEDVAGEGEGTSCEEDA